LRKNRQESFREALLTIELVGDIQQKICQFNQLLKKVASFILDEFSNSYYPHNNSGISKFLHLLLCTDRRYNVHCTVVVNHSPRVQCAMYTGGNLPT